MKGDVLFAHLKTSDRLKKTADELLSAVEKGSFGNVYASRETLHEVYYLSPKAGGAGRSTLESWSADTGITFVSLVPKKRERKVSVCRSTEAYEVSLHCSRICPGPFVLVMKELIA